jgi:hypothetical protein
MEAGCFNRLGRDLVELMSRGKHAARRTTMTDTQQSIAIALAWQEAANAQNVERLLALSDPAIEIVGPRGGASGHEVLRQWLARAGLRLTTRRIFARASVVVLAQHGVWHDATTGAALGEAEVASLARVGDGRVTHLARYDQLDAALAAAGLELADEVALPT